MKVVEAWNDLVVSQGCVRQERGWGGGDFEYRDSKIEGRGEETDRVCLVGGGEPLN